MACSATSSAAAAQPLSHIFVDAQDPRKASIHPCDAIESQRLQTGEVLVQVVKVVYTANSLTYAIAGRMPGLRYFDHFPVPADVPEAERYARSPAWGVGVVVASRTDEVSVGTRLYGLFTASPYVTLQPANVTPTSFLDGAPHRAGLIASYNTYRTREDPMYRDLATPDEEDFQVASGGLFSTGWFMYQSANADPAKPTALVLTSASSRTAYGAAFAARLAAGGGGGGGLKVFGLTSPENVDFVRGLGLYDEVAVYGAEASLPRQRAAVFDLTGSAAVLQAVYAHLREDVVSCGLVGATHVNANGLSAAAGVDTHGGAAPAPFLVFTAAQRLQELLGPQEVKRALAAAAVAFKDKMLPTLSVDRRNGAEETLFTIEEMVQGRSRPDRLSVCSLWPRGSEEPTPLASKL